MGSMADLFRQAREFLQGVKDELRKATFPGRAETLGSTGVVMGFVFAVAIFLAVLDVILVRLLATIVVK